MMILIGFAPNPANPQKILWWLCCYAWWPDEFLGNFSRKTIGEDIKTVQFGWPLGMPLVDHIEGDIWEIRIKLDNRIARVLFVIVNKTMILLHGFIKKDQKTPKPELDLAKQRLKTLRGKR